MKTNGTLLLSTLFAMAAMFLAVPGYADDAPSGDQDMQEALEHLDSLLNVQDPAAISPDALSELQGLQARFERLRTDLATRDRELATATQALAEAEVRIAELGERLENLEKPADTAVLTAQDARVKILEDESQVLKEEIERQYQRSERAEEARQVAVEEIERLTEALSSAREALEARKAGAPDTDRLKEDLAASVSEVNRLKEESAALRTASASEGSASSSLAPEVERLKGELASSVLEVEGMKGELAVSRAASETAAAREASALEAQQELVSETERLKGELASALVSVAGLEARMAENASLSISEEKARELAGALEEMKAVDTQRKEAMDDLFRQLASQKKEVVAREADLAAVREDLTRAGGVIAERERELATRSEQLAAQEKALVASRAEQDALNAKLAEAGQTIKGSADALSVRETELQAVRREMDRVKLVDEQRRQTLDETLAALAEARQRLGIQGGELEQARGELARNAREADEKLSALTDRKLVLDREIDQMEKDVVEASAARDAAQAKVQELRAALTERDRQVVDLEEQVARLTAVDDQRRKAMDRILLDVATLEQDKGKLQVELQRLQAADVAHVAGDRSGAADAQLAEARREKDSLLARIASLESVLQERGAETTVAAVPVPDSVAVASDPSAWAQEKARMEAQLLALNNAMTKDAERLKQMEQELEQARQASGDLASKMKDLEGRKPDIRESDLYKELEQINSLLREKMLEIEADRQRLALAAEGAAKRDAEQAQAIGTETQARAKAEAALTEALAREEEYKELIERLVPQVDELEKQVTALAQERTVLTNRMRERDEDLQSLKVELERREHRLAKAERVAEVLEKARTEVMQAGDREKLNMHYNMASVYARESKFAEAEREYLQALRIDPTDADVHYNLGILYDDELKQPEKATLHYRRYLQLSPHGPDADRVRNWLMKLEMRTQR